MCAQAFGVVCMFSKLRNTQYLEIELDLNTGQRDFGIRLLAQQEGHLSGSHNSHQL